MRTKILGAPSFAYVQFALDPGESVLAETGAMASMDAAVDLTTLLRGGLFAALVRRFLGRQSLFVSRFSNNTTKTLNVTLVQATPGDVKEVELTGTGLCLRPGAYLASTPGVRLGVRWAGWASVFAKEGLFRLFAQGEGRLWIGAYGGLFFRDLDAPLLVDSGHVVAYEPSVRLGLGLEGGLFASMVSGKGIVARLEGKGRVTLQSRNLKGLSDYMNPKLR